MRKRRSRCLIGSCASSPPRIWTPSRWMTNALRLDGTINLDPSGSGDVVESSSKRFAPMAMEGTGETDSLAEREEFEPSVAFERMVNFAKEPYGGYKESSIGREFSLEDMLDSFTQRKNVTAPGLGEITCIRL